jgi:hypothetical protein
MLDTVGAVGILSGVRPASIDWTAPEVPDRCAQTYLFAWHPIDNGEHADHRNPNQREFYVVSAARLPQGQRTIALTKIKTIAKSVKLKALSAAVDAVCASG